MSVIVIHVADSSHPDALSSLFGLLGHVLPKLETLKVLRALQRHNDGTVDGELDRSPVS